MIFRHLGKHDLKMFKSDYKEKAHTNMAERLRQLHKDGDDATFYQLIDLYLPHY